MHEIQLMHQVVQAVEHALRDMGEGAPTIVRLRLSALSHLAGHDQSTLRTAFELASLGTRAEGASLDVVIVPVQAHCGVCGHTVTVDRLILDCEVCGATDIEFEKIPEAIVQEVVVTE